MKSFFYLLLISTLLSLFTACSPINSVEPFDQKQAAILISKWRTCGTARLHTHPQLHKSAATP